jgi:hypothetical protein
MNRVSALLVLLTLTAACGTPNTAPPPPPAPPVEAAPAATPEPEPEPGPAAAESAAAPRVVPDRWWHLASLEGDVPSAHLDAAHELLANRSPQREIVVAVIDGGVDIQHEDLRDVLWVNPGEVAGNGVDDDDNGYVDDVYGWNFIGGADGRSVDRDTYEMTRLHAACIGAAAAGPLESPAPEVCSDVATAYEAERQEMLGINGQITQIQQLIPIIGGILGTAVGAEPTVANVTALETTDPRLSEAKNIFLQFAAAGIDEEMLVDQAEEVQGRLEYGLDIDFDPRPIVGDDFSDPTERLYGNGDVEGPDPGHGTSVASVVAAQRDNGVGIDGAASGVRIMVLRAVPNGDERDKDVANAIRYAVDNGAAVINMSFGKAFSPEKATVDEAVRYADDRGVLMVHASGNDGANLAEGANFPNTSYQDGGSPSLWIEVGASGWQTRDNLAATFSNYGATQVDIFAPGVAIMAAAPDDEYEASDGTSLSAPVVTGIAGLLLAYFPDLDAESVRRLILDTATDASGQMVVRPGGEGGSVLFGELSVTGGVVNAAAAVRRALEDARER